MGPLPGKHYVYVLECSDGTLYTGYSNDVEARVRTHNAGKGAKYTRPRLPVKLFAYAEFDSKQQAMSIEARFKRLSRAQKDLVLLYGAKGLPAPWDEVDFVRA